MFGKALVLLVASLVGQVDRTVDRSATSVIVHVFVGDSSVTTGAGLTGLTNASSGLVISAIHPGDASATVYSVASSNVETISTLGTYAAPTSGKVRFKEVDSSNMPGVYELHLANGLFSVSADTTLRLTLKGATNMRVTNYTMQIGSPANMVRLNGALTDGSPAEASRPALYLSHLNASNPSGNGVTFQSTATSGSYHGLYAQGAGSGAGFRGLGGNGTANVAATAGAGFEMAGGISSGSPSGTSEWGGPAIRVLGNWAPAFTIKGDAGPFPLLSIFSDVTGTHTGDAVSLSPRLAGHCISLYPGSTSTSTVFFSTSSNANNIAMDVGGGSNAGAIRLTGGYGMTGSIIGNITGSLSGNVGGLNGPITGLLSEPIDVTASTANTVTCGGLAGVYPDDTFNNNVLVCSNFNTAVCTDYVGATGRFTVRCLQTDGNWISNPDPGTPDTIQFTSMPFELKTSTAGSVWDNGSRTLTSFGSLVSDLTAAGGTITVTSPVQQSGRRVEIVQGDDYSNDDGRAIDFTSASWPTLTSASVVFQAQATPGTDSFTKAMSVVTATGTKKVRLELTDTETAARTPGTYSFSVVATLSNGNKVTLSRGTMVVLD